MSCHDRFQPIIDQVLINLSKTRIPLFTAKIIHAVCHMLVPEIQSIARKMLCRTAESRIRMSAVQIGFRHFHDPIHFISIGPKPDHRILPIIQDITDRRKREVTADGCCFFIGHITQVVCILYISCGADFCLAADRRAVHTGAVPAIFRIAGNDQRNLTVFLQNTVLFMNFIRSSRIVTDSSDMILLHRHFQIFFITAGTHIKEQLPYFFIQRHPLDRIFHPLAILIRQIKGIRFHIYHNKPLLSFFQCNFLLFHYFKLSRKASVFFCW